MLIFSKLAKLSRLVKEVFPEDYLIAASITVPPNVFTIIIVDDINFDDFRSRVQGRLIFLARTLQRTLLR